MLHAGSIAAVFTKQFHITMFFELVELMKRNAGHATFVLLTVAVNIEVAKANDLTRRVFKLGTY